MNQAPHSNMAFGLVCFFFFFMCRKNLLVALAWVFCCQNGQGILDFPTHCMACTYNNTQMGTLHLENSQNYIRLE